MEGKRAAEDNLTVSLQEIQRLMLAKLFLLPSPVRFLPDGVVQPVSEHSSLCPHLYNSKVMRWFKALRSGGFLLCRKHSTLMTGEVKRRSIQTLKQENRPKFGPLIKAGRPKKKKKKLWSSTPPLRPKDFPETLAPHETRKCATLVRWNVGRVGRGQ